MIDTFAASIVRLFAGKDEDIQVAGTGFLVGTTYIITCAHVVAQALDIEEETEDVPPGTLIYLDFPKSSSKQRFTAHVICWHPPQSSLQLTMKSVKDIAVLELSEAVPQDTQPTRFSVLQPDDRIGHQFYTYGFPAGYNQSVSATGELRAIELNGWMQLGMVSTTGIPIEPGFSGAPVWDKHDGGVVGMIVEVARKESVHVAFAIPIELLIKAWPELDSYTNHAFPSILEELAGYLQALTMHLAWLPAYYPQGFSFDYIRQRIKIKQQLLTSLLEDDEDVISHTSEEGEERGSSEKERAYKTWTELSYQGDDESLLGEMPVKLMHEEYETILRTGIDSQTTSKIETVIMDWEMLRNEIKRGVILGDPGSGKSWLLKYEGRALAREQLKKIRQGQLREEDVVFPLFLRLGTFAEESARSNVHVLELIEHLVKHEYTLSERFSPYLKRWLTGSQCVLLLDGLDEVAEDRRTHLQETLRQLADTSNCRILLTSRLVGYRGVSFVQQRNRWKQEMELVTFTQQQIEAFIGNWFAKRVTHGTHLSSTLRTEPHLRLLAGIPLLLSFLCLATALSETIPTRRAELYERVLRLLLEASWKNTRSTIREDSFQALVEEKSALLEHLAWHFATFKGRWHDLMREEELWEVAKKRSQEQYVGPAIFSTEHILTELTEKDAILVKVGSSQRVKQKGRTPYLFLHRTFHEFLTARYLAAQPVDTYLTLIQPHLWFDTDWEVVILLFAGCVDDPNPLLKALLQEPQDAFHSMLLLAGRCLSEARKSTVKKELKDTIVERLFTVLHSPSKEDRSRAIAVLGKLGEMALEKAIAIVLSKKYSLIPDLERVRIAAAEILGQLNHPRATQILVGVFQEALKSKNPDRSELFGATARALGKINSQQSTELLIQASIDANGRVRASIIPGLKYLNNPLAIEMLTRALLESDSNAFRRDILNTLKLMNYDKVSEILLNILSENYRSYRWIVSWRQFAARHVTLISDLATRKTFVSVLKTGAVLALEEKGNPAVDALLEAVQHHSEGIAQSWEVNWEISQPEETVVSTFLASLRDFPKECQELLGLREILAWVIGQITCLQTDNLEEVNAYIEKVQASGKMYDKDYQAYLLERSKVYQEKSQVEGLLLALQSMNEIEIKHYEHYTQLWILSKVIFAWIDTARAENVSHNLALLVIDALGDMGGNKITLALIDFLRIEKNNPWSKSFYTRLVTTLGRIGDSQATQILLEVLQDPDSAEKIPPLSVLTALGKSGNEQAVAPLLALLQESDHDRLGLPISLRARVAQTLGEIGDPRVVEALQLTLYDQDEAVRTESARALGNMGDLQTLNTLLTEISADPLNTIFSDALTLLPQQNTLIGSPLKTSMQRYKMRQKLTEKALVTFGGQKNPKIAKILLEALRQRKASNKIHRIETNIFGYIARKQDISLLIRALMDKEEGVITKLNAIRILSYTNDIKALEMILVCLQDASLYYASRRALERIATHCSASLFCKYVLSANWHLDLNRNARIFLYELLLRQAPLLRDEAGRDWQYWQKRLMQPMKYIQQRENLYISHESWPNKLVNIYSYIIEIGDMLSKYQLTVTQNNSSSLQDRVTQSTPRMPLLHTALALLGITERTIAWLSYLGGGITGLFFLLWWWRNRFIRLHSFCSIGFYILLSVLISIFHRYHIYSTINVIFSFFSFTLWIYFMVLAREGKLPTLFAIIKLTTHRSLLSGCKKRKGGPGKA